MVSKRVKRFFGNVDKALLSSVSFLVVLILGFIWYAWGPQTEVPMWGVSIIILTFYLACIVIYAIIKASKEPVIYKLPDVKSIIHDPKLIFLAEKNDLFYLHSLVTIYYQPDSDEIEHCLGVGYVETINSKGNMQIVFSKVSTSPYASEVISNLNNSKRNALRIRPTISIEDWEG